MLIEYETLLSVIVGAAIGFLTSIGYEWWSESWREGREKKDLKRKIREELKLNQSSITHYLEGGEEKCRISSEVFEELRQDLIRKLRIETFIVIIHTYSKIAPLRVFASTTYIEEALADVKHAIKLLDQRSA